MAKSRKRQAAPTPVAEGPSDIWAHLEGRGYGAAPEKVVQAAPNTDSAALLARIDALERSNRDYSAQIARVAAAPAQAAAAHQRVEPGQLQVSLEGLPNQYDEPEKWAQMYNQRVNAAIAANAYAIQAQTAERNDQATATARVWGAFTERHPEWAQYKKIVGETAREAVADAEARGLDAHRYMFVTSEAFFDDIVGRLKKEGYDRLLEEDDGEDEGDTRPGPGVRTRPGGMSEEEEGRTSGIFGGLESGGKPAAAPVPASDLLSDLKAVQTRMGIY